MGCVLLAINRRDTVFPAKSNECGQCNFGCIGNTRKHGFTKNGFADGDAIEATDQLSTDPRFHAVRVPRMVKLAVGINHGWHDPRSGLTVAHSASASFNNASEIGIKANLALSVACKPGQSLAQ